jgi:nucleoside-diphosphate-sugar epimerase
MKILVTGANGFVGRALCTALNEQGFNVIAAVREQNNIVGCKTIAVGEVNVRTIWKEILKEVDVVIHLAARVHVMREITQDPLAEFRKVNVEGTLHLAKEASNAGVKRLIFLSSIKVNGESTLVGSPFTFTSVANPQDAYGVSKYEAEEGLKQIAKATGLEVVTIRPPLVYGTGVKANFANMFKLVKLGLPLPFGAIHNKRSLIYIENLTGFITSCITHPNAANKTFLVSDGKDVSTTQLLKACAFALNKTLWLIPLPRSWLVFMFKLLGKASMADRLLGNLQIDSQYACQTLAWQPSYTLAQGLQRTVNKMLDTDKVKN